MRFAALERHPTGSNRSGAPAALVRREFPAGLCGTSARSRYGCMLRQGERAATIRCDQGFRIESSNQKTRQVDQVPHTEAVGDLPKLGTSCRKEAAQQSIATEPLQPFLPTVGATPQPLDVSGQIRRNPRRTSVKDQCSAIDLFNIISRRKALHHALPGRIKAPSVLDAACVQSVLLVLVPF
jgi:hypothetical protein